jgi:Dolichyl-phosphate-mannose-protein mannosyltransferase
MRGGNAVRALSARVSWLAERPVVLLPALAVVELGIVAWLAFRTPHNGWVWYSGGDATEYWTAEWSIAHGLIPQAIISFGLPVLYGWVPLVTGTTLLHGLQVIAPLQALVLVPLVLVLVWAVADRLYGRRYAAAASTLWAVGPLLLLWGLSSSYRPQFEQQFLAPHWAGLTNMADLPSVAAVLACAWATLRAADSGRFDHGIVAGVLGGVMIGLKPANGFFVPAVAVLLLLAWRPKVAVGWAAGMVPALLTLTLWKAQGLGHLPITSAYRSTREAAAAPLAITTSRYIPLDWHNLGQELIDLREVFWSVRLLEFLAVAGALGAIRRVPAKGAFLAVWFAAFAIVKGSSNLASVSDTSYFRFVEPGLPAFVLLIAAIGFLWPVRGRRVAWPRKPESWSFRLSPGLAAAAAVALVPLLVIAVARPASAMRTARNNLNATEAPISAGFGLTASSGPGGVLLAWEPPSVPGSTHVRYLVLRATQGDGCTPPPEGANECFLAVEQVGSTALVRFVDHPRAGRHAYRVAMVADYRNAPTTTDLMLLSEPAFATTR